MSWPSKFKLEFMRVQIAENSRQKEHLGKAWKNDSAGSISGTAIHGCGLNSEFMRRKVQRVGLKQPERPRTETWIPDAPLSVLG